MCLWVCALYNSCSRAVVKCYVFYAGSAREASGQAVFVNGRAPKTASLGSWDIIFLSSQLKGHGVTMYDSFDFEAIA